MKPFPYYAADAADKDDPWHIAEYPGMLRLWPVAIEAGVVPAGTKPEDIFDSAEQAQHKPGSPREYALSAMLVAAALNAYVTRRTRPPYVWEADAPGAWGPAGSLTDNSRRALDLRDINEMISRHADALYAADTALRVAFLNADKSRNQTMGAAAMNKAFGESSDSLIKTMAERYMKAGRSWMSKRDAATRIAMDLKKKGGASYVYKRLCTFFPGDAWPQKPRKG